MNENGRRNDWNTYKICQLHLVVAGKRRTLVALDQSLAIAVVVVAVVVVAAVAAVVAADMH